MKTELVLVGLALAAACVTTATADEIITPEHHYTIIKPREPAPNSAVSLEEEPVTATRRSIMPTITPVPPLPAAPAQRPAKVNCPDGSRCDHQPNALMPVPSSGAGR